MVRKKEIDRIIEALKATWYKFPALRLGQLIENARSVRQAKTATGSKADLFYFEDEEILEALWDYYAI